MHDSIVKIYCMINKLIRTVTSVMPVDENRTGECNQCGECCKLPNKCIFLKTNSENVDYCSIYKIRPKNCRKFPRTKSQLESVINTCGFSFDNARTNQNQTVENI